MQDITPSQNVYKAELKHEAQAIDEDGYVPLGEEIRYKTYYDSSLDQPKVFFTNIRLRVARLRNLRVEKSITKTDRYAILN
jgi:hypothetical protein